jgi:hypothetical protein
MEREKITVGPASNPHLVSFSFSEPLQYGKIIWATFAEKYKENVLDHYAGALSTILTGVARFDVEPQAVRLWLKDEALGERSEITQTALDILTDNIDNLQQ